MSKLKESILIYPSDLDQDGFISWVGEIAQRDRLSLIYAPIQLIPYWAENFKKHDIGAIWQSIEKYGFRDPFAWDKHLNDGQGGIVEGNGRREALEHGFKAGQKPPRGILKKDGCWYAPLLVGVDSSGEREAIAYGIDHNSLGLKGSNFTALDISNLFEHDEYLAALEDLAQFDAMPISVDGDDLDFLIKELNKPIEEPPDENPNPPGGKKEIDCVCPECGAKFIRQMGHD